MTSPVYGTSCPEWGVFPPFPCSFILCDGSGPVKKVRYIPCLLSHSRVGGMSTARLVTCSWYVGLPVHTEIHRPFSSTLTVYKQCAHDVEQDPFIPLIFRASQRLGKAATITYVHLRGWLLSSPLWVGLNANYVSFSLLKFATAWELPD